MKSKGFTILELIVAIVILGILAAIAIPGFARYGPDMRLKGAVRDLKSDMTLARAMAIRENALVALIFDTGNNRYTVFVDNGAGGGVAGDWTKNGSEALVKIKDIPSDVTMYEVSFSGGVQRCRFNSRGLPDNIIGHVYMRNTNNEYMGVELFLVGTIRIQESTDGGGAWNDVD
jgi:prepilin-type N-terminal cleavage/methylation domain-containing protein